jgi:hypothetical protein
MLIPQYTIRWMLAVTAVCAVIFSIAAAGVRGSQWAMGVSAGVLGLMAAFLVYGLVFCLLWAFSLLMGLFRSRMAGRGRTPFAGEPVDGDRKQGER